MLEEAGHRAGPVRGVWEFADPWAREAGGARGGYSGGKSNNMGYRRRTD